MIISIEIHQVTVGYAVFMYNNLDEVFNKYIVYNKVVNEKKKRIEKNPKNQLFFDTITCIDITLFTYNPRSTCNAKYTDFLREFM